MNDQSTEVSGREGVLRLAFLLVAVVSVFTFISRPSDSAALEGPSTEVARTADPLCQDPDIEGVIRGLLANEGYFAGPKISLLLEEFYTEFGETYDCVDIRIFIDRHTNPFGD